MTRPTTLFHAGPTHGLTRLEPRRSTHGVPWVYATPHVEMVVPYLAGWGDLDFAQWHVEGTFHLVERYPGAFRTIFEGVSGSIYRVPADSFRELEPGGPEWVSDLAVEVLEETRVIDAWTHLRAVSAATALTLYVHPDRPPFVPADDSDLVAKVARWMATAGVPREESVLYRDFRDLHPALLDALHRALEEARVR